MGLNNPYSKLPAHAFWRSGVADVSLFNYSDIWKSKWILNKEAHFSTYGSCFAQHISRALMAQKYNWLNTEPAPGKTSEALAKQFNYNIFSSRTGNIYTAKQLAQWITLAKQLNKCDEIEIWEKDGRFQDSLRPTVEPNGFTSVNETRACLRATAKAFRNSITDADVFVFTMGLTEGWENKTTGQPYPLCPGTIAGDFDEDAHLFVNYTYPEIHKSLCASFKEMWKMNKNLKILLTVSPVPLTATASGDHVLSATSYSKATLRAVAGDLRAEHDAVDYFPSYEIIASPSSRATFFAPNLRSVEQDGVNLVMGHFFAGLDMSLETHDADKSSKPLSLAKKRADIEKDMAEENLVCEEMALETFNEA